jgi:hypothetical protein
MGWCLLTRVLFVFSFVQLVLRYKNLMEFDGKVLGDNQLASFCFRGTGG